MKAWVISDTHFNHDAIIGYCNRPEDHELRMMRGLEKVNESDLLVHLGDVCIGNDNAVHDGLSGLKCRKVLVRGNHDGKSWSWYMEHGWDFVCDAFRLEYCGRIVMFSHIPQPWDGIWDVNVHGHLHNLGRVSEIKHEMRQWHRLYAPEIFDYKPVELSKLIQKEGNNR